jgi:hypothetical protein
LGVNKDLKPCPEELMDAHDVSTIVNSAKYDGPDCIKPVSEDETPRTGQLCYDDNQALSLLLGIL